ncbi:CD3337/EF1877 family mobilome membrane protein [Enterococcus faecium]|uniref:FUSC family protein n=1 Tax=Enterococcus faecium TaxID=1352 RepID=A0A7V7GR46_ENTFC|nr:FUSC family protein [Enterococcus faecium]KAA0692799.1 FUSC family protein [Enterococcus faecium]MBK5026277.1 FUSC family protein [Enterococcus faecium]MBK5036998.1 FUSC family protein [Enterococcus faecium]MBK5043274.1 FUSC family protein [Enterococcus faecium]MBK5066681.1 FUSC family protein [Enterococcus faecium]
MKKKFFQIVGMIAICLCAILLILSLIGTVAEATGLVDDTVKAGNLYSQYSLNNYQLDFFVDSSWDWLPWNWGDGLGKSVMYGLYAITNFIWTVSLYLSNATGYVVQEAYKLDFISDTAESIGKNIQTLAGITENGLQTSGFYFGFLLLMILALGVYVVYTGLLKRETTKAVRAVINFVMIFLLSGSFIAYAPTYITKINDFSSDVSEAALSLGTEIVVPNSESQGKDSVDLIRDSLFSIQVQQPWLLLQFDDSNIEEIGEDRVNKILTVSPDENKGKDREEAVKAEIEDNDNANLSITKTMNRLGTVVFLVLFNIGISFFVFLLTGIMLFSQILFIIFAMFLPISFLLSMLPTNESLGKKALIRLFNTIMMRAGVTLVITTAFSISTMFFNISATYPFFMVAFLQIVTFAGIYFKLGDIMSMFNLQSNDSQSMGRRVMRKPQMLMNRKLRQLNRNVGRTLAFGGATVGNKLAKEQSKSKFKPSSSSLRKNSRLSNDHEAPSGSNKDNQIPNNKKRSRMNLTGRKVGKILDTQALVKDKTNEVKDQVRNTPTDLKYNFHKGIEKTKKAPEEFKRGLVQEKANRAELREKQRQRRDEKMAEKRKTLNESGNRHGKRRGNVPIKAEAQPQKDRMLKKETPKRIMTANSNPEIKRKLASQEIISKGKSQSASKKNSFQQVKQRSTLPKRTNQKVQKRINPRPKSRSGEKK